LGIDPLLERRLGGSLALPSPIRDFIRKPLDPHPAVPASFSEARFFAVDAPPSIRLANAWESGRPFGAKKTDLPNGLARLLARPPSVGSRVASAVNNLVGREG